MLQDSAKVLRKLFSKQDKNGRYIRCFSAFKRYPYIYLGTSNGLFVANVRTYDFQRVVSVSQDSQVNDIACVSKGRIVIASSTGVYLERDSPFVFRQILSGNIAYSGSDEKENVKALAQKRVLFFQV